MSFFKKLLGLEDYDEPVKPVKPVNPPPAKPTVTTPKSSTPKQPVSPTNQGQPVLEQPIRKETHLPPEQLDNGYYYDDVFINPHDQYSADVVVYPATQGGTKPVTGPYANDPYGPPANDKFKRPYTPKPLYEKADAIIIVVESTRYTAKYQNDIMRLVNKIITDNPDSYFMFLRIGSNQAFSELFNSTKVKELDLKQDFFGNITEKDDVNIEPALLKIDDFVMTHLLTLKTIHEGAKLYRIDGVKLIFIGQGKSSGTVVKSSSVLKTLCKDKGVKTVKYFCIKDEDAINAAKLGFPVIGHIESNFYK